LHRDATVGVGIPGTISRLNARGEERNSVWMIGSRLTRLGQRATSRGALRE